MERNNIFANILAFVITICVFSLWLIPAFMQYHGGSGEWGALYVPIVLVGILWGFVLYQKYFR